MTMIIKFIANIVILSHLLGHLHRRPRLARADLIPPSFCPSVIFKSFFVCFGWVISMQGLPCPREFGKQRSFSLQQAWSPDRVSREQTSFPQFSSLVGGGGLDCEERICMGAELTCWWGAVRQRVAKETRGERREEGWKRKTGRKLVTLTAQVSTLSKLGCTYLFKPSISHPWLSKTWIK